MNKAETITQFAGKIEALSLLMGLTNAEFVYVLEALKHKRVKIIFDKEEGK